MKTGFTCSAFDILHAGHVMMLEEAKKNCDYLIVGLQIDPSRDRPEKNKPVQTVFERYIQLRGNRFVDEIIPYDTEEDLETLLLMMDIDVRFVGEEYTDKEFTGKEFGIPIHYNKRRHALSSSALRERIKNS